MAASPALALASEAGREASALAPQGRSGGVRPGRTPLKEMPLGPGLLSLEVGLRSRYEYLNNFTVKHYAPGRSDDALLWRGRIGFDYRFQPQARFFVQFQDARYWLNRMSIPEFGRTCSYWDEFDLRQAFVEWQRIGGSPFGVKLGRQSLQYCGRRLFSPGQWGNVGRFWWDGVRANWEADAVRLEAFYGQRVLTEPERWNWRHHPWHVGALYLHTKRLPVELDFFYTIKNDWESLTGERGGRGDEARHTFGLYAARPPGKGWDWAFFGAGQLGEYGGDDIRAFGLMAQGGYAFPCPGRPRLGVEFDWGSGDDDPSDGVQGTYDGAFGAMDAPYGWMNVVSIKNLQDYVLKAFVHPFRTVECSAEGHFFRLAQPRDAWHWPSGKAEARDPSGRAGRDLGRELDLLCRWRPAGRFELFAGYAHFFPGAAADRLLKQPGGADWAFCQASWSY